MTKLDKLKHLVSTSTYYKPLALRLTEHEFDIMCEFALEHEEDPPGMFRASIMAMHLDKPKSTHWTIIEDILIATSWS